MRKIMVLSLFASLTASLSFADILEHPRNLKEETRIQEKAQKRWLWSAIALTAASFADVHSSWGKRETNSLLRSADGTFGAKGMAIKIGIVSGIVLSQRVLVSKSPAFTRPLTYANYGMAGMKFGVAAHNYGIAKPTYLLRQP